MSQQTSPVRPHEHLMTIAEIVERYRFPSYKAAHVWLRRRRHLIQPLRAGQLLYSAFELERVMRGRKERAAA